MANVGYVRVSTAEQNTGRQFGDFEKAGIKLDKVFEEKISGKDRERPKLQAMMEYVREGDKVYIESYSRLARNTRDLLNIVHELEEKKVTVVSLKENFDTSSKSLFVTSVTCDIVTLRCFHNEGIWRNEFL